jgi:pepF/M3 family oligoendopeptidase
MNHTTVQDSLPHWDMTNVYSGLDSEDFQQAIELLEARLDDLDLFLKTNKISRTGSLPNDSHSAAAIFDDYLDKMNGVLHLYGTIRAYVYSFLSTDSYDITAKRLASETDKLGVRIRRQEVLFRGWLGLLKEQFDAFFEAIEQGTTAGKHAFYLKETADQSQYLMSEAEETLAAELNVSGAMAWSRLQNVIRSQLKAQFRQSGQDEELPITLIQAFYNHPDEMLRRQAYEVELNAWQLVREPLAACLNGIKGSVITLDRRRNRQDALHQTLEQARIDRQTLEVMLGAMRDSFPVFRRYWQAKARRLGKERLPWWDLSAPVASRLQSYSYQETTTIILEQFGTFSLSLADFSKNAFEKNWIDAEPRDGKVGGGFCMNIPAAGESRILVNYDGSLDQLMTLAHELGHAYHNHRLKGKTQLQRRTPMTLAETASIFNQTIITDALLASALNAEEELIVLESFLADSSQVIVDIYSRYLFETEIFERRAQAELSADDFCQIMLECQQETYGVGLDSRYRHPYMWAWKPHYYNADRSFYNFPYAFGLLFGLGLYKIYQVSGSDFLERYDQLLSSTGEATAYDLALQFDIDLHQPSFWQEGLSIVEERTNRYEAF